MKLDRRPHKDRRPHHDRRPHDDGRLHHDGRRYDDSRLYEIDALRFVAAVAVVMCHFTGVPGGAWPSGARATFPELNPAADFGYLGVDLFFVVSGFVVLMSLWDKRPSEFVVSRVVRIFPAYWCCVLLAVVIYYATGWAVDYGPHSEGVLSRLLPNLTMLQSGVGAPQMELVYWTLWTELHFYALLVFLAWRGVAYRRAVIFMLGWLLLEVFSTECNSAVLQYLFIPRWAPYFIAGMAFSLIYRFGSSLVLWLVIAVCYALMAYAGVKQINPLIAWKGVHEWLVPTVIAVIFVVMGLVAVDRLRWLRVRWFATLGALTFPLYLLHETVSRPLIRTLASRHNRWTVLGVALIAALACAYLVHLLVERPLQPWLKRRLNLAVQQIRREAVVLRGSSRPVPQKRSAAIERAETLTPG